MQVTYTFAGPVWVYPGKGGWHFVTIPPELSEEIGSLLQGMRRRWGSFPATITIGDKTWESSVFPDTASATFVAPLKAAVRNKEQFGAGDVVTVRLALNL
jgi:hypothetical protein